CDLGIDSIKRVEISSELEKQLPDRPGVATDNMGTLKTLADICQVIEGSDAPAEAPAAQAAPVNGGSSHAAPAGGEVMTVLSAIISDLTGFPVDMLEPEMDIESDLGIDSIKRVEILSRLEQELKDAPPMAPDDMARLKTIGDMVNFLDTVTPPTADTAAEKKKTPFNGDDPQLDPQDNKEARSEASLPLDEPDLLSREIRLNTLSTNEVRFFNGARIHLAEDRKVYISRDGAGMAQALADEFAKLEIPVQLFDLPATPEDTPEFSDAAGLIIVQPDVDASAPWDNARAISQEIQKGSDFLTAAFCLARKNAAHLATAAEENGAFFTTVSFLGGKFGFDGKGFATSPAYGGMAGLAKTAALEWPNVLCRALDLPDDPTQSLAQAEAAAALTMIHGEVEMGLTGSDCHIPTLVPHTLDNTPVELNTRDTIVITGGAKGVTAECALELAKSGSPAIALLGRSPEPGAEPKWASAIEGAALKKEILAQEFAGEKITPAQLEKRYREIISNREIHRNMARIAQAGSRVNYYSTDVRDPQALEATLAQVRKDFGEITVVVHGAGVLEDKLIADKAPEAFSRVLSTKVDGLSVLLSATAADALKYVVFFSSVAARGGNTGQCDYAMANEVLNKVAQKLTLDNPDCRYLSLNWGPWDGGMVNPSLKKEFTRKGIQLIPLAGGARQMALEMGNSANSVEIVIGAGLTPSDHPVKPPVLSKTLTQPMGISQAPVLDAHRIDKSCVVPFALLTELMAMGAEKNNPGLTFAGMDDVRLLKGVIPDGGTMELDLSLGKCKPGETGFKVAAELSTTTGEKTLRHMNGTCLLKNQLPAPPVLSQAAFMELGPCSFDAEKAYEEILFHGPALQGIEGITGVSSKGIEVVTALAPAPAQWMTRPMNTSWTLDPLMVDAAFQAAILWTWENRKQVCLPAYVANLRCYSSYENLDPKTDKIRIVFTVNEESEYKLKGYFTFLTQDNVVVASITGFEAIIDPALQEKFNPAPAFDRERILAFAQGNPSDAFGPAYKVFDSEREIARLPRPPYFFMDEVLRADHPQWEMKAGGWIEARYEVPADAWYFKANHSPTMPFCILLEIALQPCGWLAAYAGSALTSSDRLHFRNLGGKADLTRQVTPDTGTLTMRSRMTEVSQAGGMIIQNFDMEVLSKDGMIYQGTTNFGFFSSQALANQVGIRESELVPRPEEMPEKDGQVHTFEALPPLTPADAEIGENKGMPAKALRMIDAIDAMESEGGIHGKGYIRAHKMVDPDEWYFHAHFYQDPVCPGSLGVESFLQMLRFFLKEKFGIDPQALEAQMQTRQSHEWIYRGQIIPKNKKIQIHAHIKGLEKEVSGDGQTAYAVQADGALVVDGICIYEMKDFGVAFVPAGVEKKSPAAEETLSS
ncbi:MAG: SDR family NAD(P)-dependent oxidoreductase, partial [Desulfobacterales bacterium]|nr:SDR family NAD(P)-dependent oxidoreductase [Desulfobacterales bacterium]